MSILALFHRIGSGKRGLPLIVQSRAIWATAGFITAFTLAVILVSVYGHPALVTMLRHTTGPDIFLPPRHRGLGCRADPNHVHRRRNIHACARRHQCFH